MIQRDVIRLSVDNRKSKEKEKENEKRETTKENQK